VIPEERAELQLLSLANEKGKFGLEYGMPDGQVLQEAFERGIDEEWFTLVDLCPAAAVPATARLQQAGRRVLRVFRLTPGGREQLARLTAIAKDDTKR
jgi:hypothetical protein